MKPQKKQAFTLVEIITWVLIVSIVILWAFQALTSLGFWKIRLMHKTATQKQMLYFSEKLFEMIKYGGTIDFEEYFNRKIVNQWFVSSNIYGSGHYKHPSGYGNFWPGGTIQNTTNYSNGYYYCVSNGWNEVGNQGCVTGTNVNTINLTSAPSFNQDFSGDFQTYGQYSFQFWDYNSNLDADNGDEDGNNLILWDDDDDFFGRWPNVFSTGAQVAELYLINWVKRQRTFFRYNVKLDPHRPVWATCTSSDDNRTFTWSGCLWTIEYLMLDGKDWWLDHDVATQDITQYDGVIDTWLINQKFTWWAEVIADSNTNNYWQPLFPENISVTEFKIFPHPNIDQDRAWDINDPQVNISEYVRVSIWMQPAWRERKKIKWNPKEYKFTTTINLTDIFSR